MKPYEHRKHPLLPRRAFLQRAGVHFLWAALILFIGVGIGTTGYHMLAGLGWIDAFLNASMIAGGMGPVDPLKDDAAKLFASLYALFSGLVFVGVMGIALAPWVHRLFHWMHLEDR